jgi:hypothetical protein
MREFQFFESIIEKKLFGKILNKHKYNFLSLFNLYLSLPQLSGAGPLRLLRLPVTIYEPRTANCF